MGREINPEIYRRFFGADGTVSVDIGAADASREAESKRIFLRFFVVEGEQQSSVEAVAKPAPEVVAPEAASVEVPAEVIEAKEPVVEPEPLGDEDSGSWYTRIKSGLAKTRRSFSSNIASLLVGKKRIDDDLLEEVETQLLMADVGVDATRRIIDALTNRLSRSQLKSADELYRALQDEMRSIIEVQSDNPLELLHQSKGNSPFVILVVGVNGVGKTTTIGKLANRFKARGLSVMLAAGDTFRAAAVEQLEAWGERNGVPVVAQHTGADSASVIYDAVAAAKSRQVDVLIADTAGRLHTKSNLMGELSKVRRVIGKLDQTAPHEVLLVLDAGTGQNALSQAQQFNEAVDVSGVVLTKLDGTAKGGILFAICEKLGLPLRYIGVGEQAADLRPFDPEDFISALFDTAED